MAEKFDYSKIFDRDFLEIEYNSCDSISERREIRKRINELYEKCNHQFIRCGNIGPTIVYRCKLCGYRFDDD